MKYATILLLIGIVANTACLLLFRFRVSRDTVEMLKNAQNQLNVNFQRYAIDTQKQIEAYLSTNKVQSVYHSTAQQPTELSAYNKQYSPLPNVGVWQYAYYEINGVSFARVRSRSYAVGDNFPLGGVITDIHPDGVIVDNVAVYSNQKTNNYQVDNTLKEIKQHEYRTSYSN